MSKYLDYSKIYRLENLQILSRSIEGSREGGRWFEELVLFQNVDSVTIV